MKKKKKFTFFIQWILFPGANKGTRQMIRFIPSPFISVYGCNSISLVSSIRDNFNSIVLLSQIQWHVFVFTFFVINTHWCFQCFQILSLLIEHLNYSNRYSLQMSTLYRLRSIVVNGELSLCSKYGGKACSRYFAMFNAQEEQFDCHYWYNYYYYW